MAFSIKPLLGQGTLLIYSVQDQSIDWEATVANGGPTVEQYNEDPWPYLYPETKLVFKPSETPLPFTCRAPKESDLEAISTHRLVQVDGEARLERDLLKENRDLFARCVEDIQNYAPDLSKPHDLLVIEHDEGPGGVRVAKPECMELIPTVIRSEIGSYLKASQEVTGDLKNA